MANKFPGTNNLPIFTISNNNKTILTAKDYKIIASILYDLFLMAHDKSESDKGMCAEAKYYLIGNLKYLDLSKKIISRYQ